MRFGGPIGIRLAAALAAASPNAFCATAQPAAPVRGPSPVPHIAVPAATADPFDALADELAAFVQDAQPLAVTIAEFFYGQTKLPGPGSPLIQNELHMALERTGRFRVITRDRVEEMNREAKLGAAGMLQTGELKGPLKLDGITAIVRGNYLRTGADYALYAELAWLEGGRANKAKVMLESKLLGDEADVFMPVNLDDSQVNLADVQKRVRSVRSDFPVELLVAEGRRVFRDGEVISYKVRSDRDCHIAVFCHQVDGSTVLLFPNRYSDNTWIPAGKTVDIPGTSKHGFEIVNGPPYGSDVVQVIACTNENELHAKVREITRSSSGPYAAMTRGQFSEYLTRGMSVVASPQGGASSAGPARWATDYVVISTGPR